MNTVVRELPPGRTFCASSHRRADVESELVYALVTGIVLVETSPALDRIARPLAYNAKARPERTRKCAIHKGGRPAAGQGAGGSMKIAKVESLHADAGQRTF